MLYLAVVSPNRTVAPRDLRRRWSKELSYFSVCTYALIPAACHLAVGIGFSDDLPHPPSPVFHFSLAHSRVRACGWQVQRHGGHSWLDHGSRQEEGLSGVRGVSTNSGGRPGQDPRRPGGEIVSLLRHFVLSVSLGVCLLVFLCACLFTCLLFVFFSFNYVSQPCLTVPCGAPAKRAYFDSPRPCAACGVHMWALLSR